ncbi:hypothetical protein niasHS_007053 [Heterodera schachtii]|uniref:Serpentine receptor class gamma n=1 Tax=Heterodera schachtii TaxID=97005 RepID=A0ABD2JFC0_HETSC
MLDKILNCIINNRRLVYYFALSISIPSTILYILEMLMITRHKQFSSSSFYKLFFIRGIYDILYLLSIVGRFFGPNIYELPNWAYAFITFFVPTFSSQASNIVTIYILLNRFSAIAFPFRYKMLWKKYFWHFIMFMLVFPILNASPLILLNPKIVTKEKTNVFINSEKDPEMNSLRYSNHLNAVTATIFLLLSLLINILTLIAYKRSKKTAKNAQNWARIEKKLLIYALLTFAGHALVSVFLLIVSTGILVEFVPLVYIGCCCSHVTVFGNNSSSIFVPNFLNQPPNKPLRQ